jgi:hypothetical protein
MWVDFMLYCPPKEGIYTCLVWKGEVGLSEEKVEFNGEIFLNDSVGFWKTTKKKYLEYVESFDDEEFEREQNHYMNLILDNDHG